MSFEDVLNKLEQKEELQGMNTNIPPWMVGPEALASIPWKKRSTYMKLMDLLSSTEKLGTEFVGRHVASALMTPIGTPEPLASQEQAAKERIQALPKYPYWSDITKAALNVQPETPKQIVEKQLLREEVSKLYPGIPGTGFISGTLYDPNREIAGAMGFGLGTATDPLMYLGVGELTQTGKAAKLYSSAIKAGKFEIGSIPKVVRASLKDAAKGVELATTPAEQAKLGQRALVSFMGHPLIYGEKIYGSTAAVAEAFRTTKLGTWLDRAFISKPHNPKFAELWQHYKDLYEYRKMNEIEMSLKTGQEIRTLSKELGIPVEDTNRAIVYLQERARINVPIPNTYVNPVAVSNPKAAQITADIIERDRKQLATEWKAGVETPQGFWDIEYATRRLNPEVRPFLERAFGLPSREWKDTHLNQLKRHFEVLQPDPDIRIMLMGYGLKRKTLDSILKPSGLGTWEGGVKKIDDLIKAGKIPLKDRPYLVHTMTIPEINELARSGKMKLLQGKSVDYFFEEDPALYTVLRGIRGQKAITSAQFFDAVKANPEWALPAEKAPMGWMETKIPRMMGYKFDPEIARHLDSYYQKIVDPQQLGLLLHLFDTAQDWWKAWTLAIFPMYHTRNFVTNMWNSMLGGLTTIVPLKLAGQVATKRPIVIKSPIYGELSGQRIYEAMRRNNVVRKGWMGSEVPVRTTADMFKEKKYWKLGRSDSKIIDMGFKVGRTIEDYNRAALFIDRIMKGDAFAEAAAHTKKHLFDYSELTAMEQQVFKRVFPFYTWPRNNIPLQIEYLIKNPGKFALIPRGKRAIESGEPPLNESGLQQWLLDSYPTRIRFDKKSGKWEYFILNNWLGAADINKVFDLKDSLWGYLSPIPKEIIEQIFNKDIYFNKKIQQNEQVKWTQDRVKFMGQYLPSRFVHGLKIIRLFNEIDKMSDPERSLAQKMVGILTGKMYPYDPSASQTTDILNMKELQKGIYSAARKASGKGKPVDMKEVERLQKLLEEKQRESQR